VSEASRARSSRPSAPSREQGLTLAELLVSMAVLLVAVACALTLYDRVWDSFKQGENAAEQQQGVRIAFERIGSDLQMAGFNHNPDGDPVRSDEQVEAAYDTAIVIRADFDARDSTRSSVPEVTLAGGVFDVVPTGNDEVVAYFLAKPDGSSTDVLSFSADMEEASRDGDQETVQIFNVALTHDDPPYTLYRATFSNDPSDWCHDDFVQRTPLAENVGSLTFRYFDEASSQINAAFDLTGTADDIGGSESMAAARGRVRAVEVSLLGLSRDPDEHWVDPSDPHSATRRFRKFRLASTIVPRNLGMVGIQDVDD
jgi:hypothetical protein